MMPAFYRILMSLSIAIAPSVLSAVVVGAANAQQDVSITLRQFGVQNIYRPGDFVGIEVQLVSNLDDAINAEVVWEVTEASGDIVEQSRVLALGPGQPASAWLYSKLLPTVDGTSVFTIRAYEDADGDRGRELGATRITPGMVARAPVLRTDSLICFVGSQRTAGINDYNISVTNPSYPDLGHEFLRPVSGVAPVDLPDRWEGLDQFEAVVWTDATPGALGSSKARAIREYVRRGGHFIIILPQVGNDWQLGSLPVNNLSGLLPSVSPQTVATDYLELLPVLSKRRTLPARANQPISIRIFDESNLDRGWEPLITTPAGDVVAIDRRFGFGHMTMIGIDIASQQLSAQAVDGGGGVFEGEMIWNIVLGRRQDTLTGSQLKTLADAKQFYEGSRSMSIDLGSGGLIREEINLRGQAFAGIGLAFVLFVAYWLLAGPVGFGLLKGAKKIRHAWLAFALTSAAFTVIAWGGVKLFSQSDTQVQHLTFLDLIAETNSANIGDSASPDAPSPGSARMTSWFTIFLPGYGQPLLTIERAANSGRNILTAFSPPGEEIGGFTNVDRYTVSIDSPATYRVPARSTTKEMYARYLGPIPSEWSDGDESIGFTITEPIVVQRGRITRGRIIHNFPQPLRDVRVFVVQANRDAPKRYSDADGTGKSATFSSNNDEGRPPNVVRAFAAAEIQPLQELSLAGVRPYAGGGLFITHIEKYYEDSKEDGVSGLTSQNAITRDQSDRFLEMLSFYQMITPPEYRRQKAEFTIDNRDRPYTVRRHFGREIDLSEWLTRPCVIIYGKLENSKLPLPLRVNSDTPMGTGLTIVRWICPLPMTTETASSPGDSNQE